MPSRGLYGLELLFNRSSRFAPACGPQGLSNPFGDGHAVTPGNFLEVMEFLLVQQDLKSLTHVDEYIHLV